MKSASGIILAITALLAACSGGQQASQQKINSPPPAQLTTQQLNDITAACLKYHDVNDARVAYDGHYCELVGSERDRRSLVVPKAEQSRDRSLLNFGSDTAKPHAAPQK